MRASAAAGEGVFEGHAPLALQESMQPLGQPAQAEEVHRALDRREAGHRRMRGVELPGMDGEDRRLAALAERPSRPPRGGVPEESGRATLPRAAGAGRGRVPVSGGISTSDQPSPRMRCGPERFERSPSGGTGIMEASQRNPAAARTGRAAAPGWRIDHSAARWTPARTPAAASIASRARSRSSRNSSGRQLVGAAMNVAVHADLVAPARRLAGKVRVTPGDPAQEEDRGAMPARREQSRRGAPSVVSIRGT